MHGASTAVAVQWPIMCWCAVKKLLTHSLNCSGMVVMGCIKIVTDS